MNLFSDLSLWWVIPWLAISIVATYWYYSGQKIFSQMEKWKRGLLLFLRGASLFLLGLLLFGILFESKDVKTQKPVLINLIDNSSSLLNYKDSTQVLQKIKDFQKTFNQEFSSKYAIENYVIDGELKVQEVDLKGQVSNHYKGFDELFNRYYNRNKGAIVFISDGNYNKGNSPIYSANKISLTPIYTLGVGDTTFKVDHMIRNVSVNDIAFYKNDFPVDIEIEANKVLKGEYSVELWQGENLLKTEKVIYDDSKQQFHTIKFLVNALSIGFIPYEVRLQRVSGEVSYENNRRKFYVEVIDSRSKVLLLSDGPHPDIKAISQMLDQEQNLEVESSLIKEWEGSLADVSLLILRVNDSEGILPIIRDASSKKVPVFYLLGAQLSSKEANELQLGITYPTGNSLDEVQVYSDEGFSLFTVSDALKKDLSKWPPLRVRFGKASVPGASLFLKQKIGPVLKSDQVLSFRNRNGRKEAILIGEGIWRWRLDDFRRNQNNDRFKEMISSISQYMLVKQNKYPLHIKLPKRFTTQDEIIINGEFYNDAMELIVNPEINLTLKDEGGKITNFTFSKRLQDYSLNIGKLAAGKYTWQATTEWNSKKYEKNGEFVVEAVSLEKLAIRADHGILRSISSNSGGKFFTIDNYTDLIKDLKSREDIKVVSYEESSFSELIEYFWLLLLIVVMLGAEWFIRKFEGGY